MKLEKYHIDGLIKKYVTETLDSDEPTIRGNQKVPTR